MGINFDRWTLLKLFELGCALACLVFKRVTDDEASRLFLYLQKLSREWSLLNNVTWDKVGAAVADATYGGYLIITGALFIGRLAGELPTHKRVTEFVLLSIGALLFIILGSLEFASLDSVPEDLVDNAAILGSLSLITAALFLLDMGGPKAKKTPSRSHTPPSRASIKPVESRTVGQQVYDIEKEIEVSERKHLDAFEKPPKYKKETNNINENNKNGYLGSNGVGNQTKYGANVYNKKMRDDKPIKTFDIYGKDVYGESETDEVDDGSQKVEEHSPVWSKIRKGQYGKYDIITPGNLYNKHNDDDYLPPSSPGDPGYVQYTAQHWGQSEQKTPRQSPTQV